MICSLASRLPRFLRLTISKDPHEMRNAKRRAYHVKLKSRIRFILQTRCPILIKVFLKMSKHLVGFDIKQFELCHINSFSATLKKGLACFHLQSEWIGSTFLRTLYENPAVLFPVHLFSMHNCYMYRKRYRLRYFILGATDGFKSNRKSRRSSQRPA